MPGNYRFANTSSAMNLHEHFGSGRSIANASSTSAPVSKSEKSKHKILSNLTSFFKPNTNKSPEPSGQPPHTHHQLPKLLQQHHHPHHQQQHSATTTTTNNNSLTVTVATPHLLVSTPSVSPTFTNNPPLSNNRIQQFSSVGGGNIHSSGGAGIAAHSGMVTNLLNFSTDLSPSASQLSVVPQLVVSSSGGTGGGGSCSTISSSGSINSCKPLPMASTSLPTNQSSPSPIEEAVTAEGHQHHHNHLLDGDNLMLSSSLESSKSSSSLM